MRKLAELDAPKNIGLRSLSSLSEWKRNYRRGDVEAIVRSIVRFGFNGALRVWKDSVVIAGNHSLKALVAMKENGAEPPRGVVVADDEWLVPCVDVSHLSEIEAQAFAIADNRSTDLATADEERLSVLLTEVRNSTEIDLDATGYSVEAADRIAATLKQVAFQALENPEDEQSKPKPGDVWQLGDHRLIVGDSAKVKSVARQVAVIIRRWEQSTGLKAERVLETAHSAA